MIRKMIMIGGMFCMVLLMAGIAPKEELAVSENIFAEEIETVQEAAVEDTGEAEHDRAFYKNILRRLLKDQIPIMEGSGLVYCTEWLFYDTDAEEKYEYYLDDVDGDGELEVGVFFDKMDQRVYKYDEEKDVLIPFIGRGESQELFGGGLILSNDHTFEGKSYYLSKVNSSGKTSFSVHYLMKYSKGWYLPDGTLEYEDLHYYINAAEVTEEQWNALFVEPIEELRRNMQPPLTYEEVMRG